MRYPSAQCLCMFFCLVSLCLAHPGFAAGPDSKEIFSEVAKAAGLDFVHFNGMSGEFYFAEPIGGGVALFDYDNDGDLDVYLTQGHMLGEGKTPAQARFPPEPGRALLRLIDFMWSRALAFCTMHRPPSASGLEAGPPGGEVACDRSISRN